MKLRTQLVRKDHSEGQLAVVVVSLEHVSGTPCQSACKPSAAQPCASGVALGSLGGWTHRGRPQGAAPILPLWCWFARAHERRVWGQRDSAGESALCQNAARALQRVELRPNDTVFLATDSDAIVESIADIQRERPALRSYGLPLDCGKYSSSAHRETFSFCYETFTPPPPVRKLSRSPG